MTPPSMRKSLPVMNAPSGPMRSAPTVPTLSGGPVRPAAFMNALCWAGAGNVDAGERTSSITDAKVPTPPHCCLPKCILVGCLKWYVVCPETGRRVRVLYRLLGATLFASRRACDILELGSPTATGPKVVACMLSSTRSHC